MLNRVFLYDDLRSAGGAFQLLLGAAATEVTPAVLPGFALYGWGLPAPVVAPHPEGKVVGEVVTLDPQRVGEVLAALARRGGELRRVSVTVDLTSGDDVEVWAYVAGPELELSEAQKVASGDWLRPL